MKRLVYIAAVVGLLGILGVSGPLGCAGTGHQRPSPPDVRRPAAGVDPFFMRQTLEVRMKGHERQVDAVVQYIGGVVTTVFLNPVGKPMVILRQRGDTLDVSGPQVDRFPFDPRWIAHDIGLALLLSPLEVAGRDGQQIYPKGAGKVVDTWTKGRLTRRRAEQAHTTIDYTWASADAECPDVLDVNNRDFGYDLTITTTQCNHPDGS